MKITASMFHALAAVAWADGVMAPSESAALVRCARSAGLSPDEVTRVEQASSQPVRLEDLGDLGVDEDQAEYLFTLACMVSGVDGDVDPREVDVLARLGERLGLGEDARDRAVRVGEAVARGACVNESALEALAKAYETGA